jgi:hypothetical protein
MSSHWHLISLKSLLCSVICRQTADALHSRTHSRTLPRTHSRTLSRTHSRTLSRTLSRTHSCTLSRTALTHALPHSLMHALTHCTHARCHALRHARCHAPTHSSLRSCTMHFTFTCPPTPPAAPLSCTGPLTRCSTFICELCCTVVRQEHRLTGALGFVPSLCILQ